MNHIEEAENLLALITPSTETDAAHYVSAHAQVHATLALVEQQRIANLIALYDMGTSDAPSGIKSIDYAALTREIVEALGIGDTE